MMQMRNTSHFARRKKIKRDFGIFDSRVIIVCSNDLMMVVMVMAMATVLVMMMMSMMMDLCLQEAGGTGKCNWSVAFTLFYSLLHILSTRSKRLIDNSFWSADNDNDERIFTMYTTWLSR